MLVTEMQWIFCEEENKFSNITELNARIRSHKHYMRQRNVFYVANKCYHHRSALTFY